MKPVDDFYPATLC